MKEETFKSLLAFEKPNFAKIMHNFVKYKYSADKIGDGKKKSMKNLSKYYILSADSLELPAPVSVYLIGTGENKAVQCDPLYHVYYKLWKKYCKPQALPKTIKKKKKKRLERGVDIEDDLPDDDELNNSMETEGDENGENGEGEGISLAKHKMRLSQLFGFSMLRLILPMIFENIDKHYRMKKDDESYAQVFYKDLTKEFNDPLSIIFHVNFDKLIEETQKLEKELDRQHQEKEESLEKYNSYKPDYPPFSRPPSFPFFDFSTQPTKKFKSQDGSAIIGTSTITSNPRGGGGGSGSGGGGANIRALHEKAEKCAATKKPTDNHPLDEFDDEDDEDEDDKVAHVVAKPLEGSHVAIGPEGGMDVISGGGRRDQNAKLEEERGILTSSIYTNDDDKESLYHLVLIRNIFSRQLPKMPKDYITRLVVDRNHRTLVIKKLQSVVGGICFRPFVDNGFIEIAFCAVTADEQVKGYGTHLMNHLKNAMQKERMLYFLTYADNNAIGYFKKQGFTKNVSLPREKWAGFIKDYDGGTLMECRINETLDYLHLPTVIRQQREAIYDRIKKNSNSHIVYPGITFFKSTQPTTPNPKIHVQHYNRNVLRKFKRIPLDQIIGIKESRSWKQTQLLDTTQEDEINLRELNQFCKDCIKLIKNHDDAWPFFEPVNYDEVPDYYEVIADPIDLQIIEKRSESGQYYVTKEIFFADLKRMFDNCRIYNKEDTIFYRCADNLEKYFCDKVGYREYFQNT